MKSVWYPLCNWGWGGFHNGYYLSNAFDSNSEPEYPTSTKNAETTNGTSGNYQYNTTVVIGIRK